MPVRKKSTKAKGIKKGKKAVKAKVLDNVCKVIPIFLIAGVTPLIVYAKVIELTDIERMYTGGRDIQADFFSYYKMVSLMLFTAAGLLAFLSRRRDNHFDGQRNLFYIPMGVYALLVVLSALASEHRELAFRGFWDRHEGVFVLMAYAAVMFLAMNVLKEEKQIKIFFLCLLASAFIIFTIGALQYFGVDYINSAFVMDLITPAVIKSRGGTLKAAFGSKTIFSTLYNPNYVGSYTAMMVPVIVTFLVCIKKVSHKLILTILLCLSAINWIGCESRAGIVGSLFSLTLLLIMFRKKVLRHKIIAVSGVILLFGVLAVVLFMAGSQSGDRIRRMASIGGKDTPSDKKGAMDTSLQGLNDILTGGEKTVVVTDRGVLQITLTDRQLRLTDENDEDLEADLENNMISFADARFQNIKLVKEPKEGPMQIFYNDFHVIDILLTKEGFMSRSNIWMTYRGNKTIEVFGFSGIESLGSNRGYIWSRTIPLLKNTILLGYGPDTFPIFFPQYDYVGKLKVYETGGIFVDKPHNMYLQTAVNTGVASLLALLAIFGIYFASSIKIYIREEFDTFLPVAGLACFAAFCGYACAGMFNDSVISVAPVFWVLLGLGIRINIMMKGSHCECFDNKHKKVIES